MKTESASECLVETQRALVVSEETIHVADEQRTVTGVLMGLLEYDCADAVASDAIRPQNEYFRGLV